MKHLQQALKLLRQNLPELEIRLDEPMSRHCSFRIGGPAAAMAFPKSGEEAEFACQLLASLEIVPFVLGNGTNLLVSGAPLDLFVLNTAGLTALAQVGETEIFAGSGVPLVRLATFAQGLGLSGLEFAHGIPGTLGGAVVMNAGAYGGEMKDAVTAVDFLDSDMEHFTLPAAELGFAYRHSIFSDCDSVILGATLSLRPGDPAAIREEMRTLMEKRRASQPLDLPSAGSTFKRPETGYAAALIDQCGLKGFSVGGAQVSPKHAGFVVNTGDATFDNVLAVMAHVQETVLRETGVSLEPEVKILR